MSTSSLLKNESKQINHSISFKPNRQSKLQLSTNPSIDLPHSRTGTVKESSHYEGKDWSIHYPCDSTISPRTKGVIRLGNNEKGLNKKKK